MGELNCGDMNLPVTVYIMMEETYIDGIDSSIQHLQSLDQIVAGIQSGDAETGNLHLFKPYLATSRRAHMVPAAMCKAFSTKAWLGMPLHAYASMIP